MYSEMIALKIDKMFNDLRIEIQEVVYETGSLNDAINNIYQRVISETTSRSELMLGDMLFELDRALFNTPFFADNLSRKNEFSSLGLRRRSQINISSPQPPQSITRKHPALYMLLKSVVAFLFLVVYWASAS